jgi:hypothetical protein
MRLYWTPSRDVSGAKASGRHLAQTETITLPSEFWNDLKQILGLLTQSRIAALTFEQPSHYVADKLAPLIPQVRALVQSREGVWNPETLVGVQFSLATALALDGEQFGKNESLDESIELYRKVLDEYTRVRVPLQWATTQNNLGNALARPAGGMDPRIRAIVARHRTTDFGSVPCFVRTATQTVECKIYTMSLKG